MMTRISSLSSILSIILFLLPLQTLAQVPCGIPFVTVECKSKNDIRYNAKINFDLKTHSEFWKSLPGFYYAKDYRFDYQNNAVTAKKPPLNNDELQEMGIDPVTDLLWSQYPQEIFLNITVQGTRMMIHKLTMARDNEGTRPGFINAVDEYYVSTHEKDGIARLIGYRFGMQEHFPPLQLITSQKSKSEATSDTTATFIHDLSLLQYTFHPQLKQGSILCENIGNQKCARFNWIDEAYTYNDGGELELDSFGRIESAEKKVEADWLLKMEQVLEELRIPDTPTAPYDNIIFAVPDLSKGCVTDQCMSEEMWRKVDPDFNTSPYLEGSGSFTIAFLATISLSSILIVTTVGFFVYRALKKRNDERMRDIFSKAVVQTHGLSKRHIGPEEALEMFQDIDEDGSGNIGKEELETLLDRGGVAALGPTEFDLLFATIDLDQSGDIDFTEFLTFLNSLPDADGGKRRSKSRRSLQKRRSQRSMGKSSRSLKSSTSKGSRKSNKSRSRSRSKNSARTDWMQTDSSNSPEKSHDEYFDQEMPEPSRRSSMDTSGSKKKKKKKKKKKYDTPAADPFETNPFDDLDDMDFDDVL